MEIEVIISKMKEIYSPLMEFIDSTENNEIKMFVQVLKKQEILTNKDEIIFTFRLLSKIADNYHRSPDFLDKLSQVIQYLIQEIQIKITDFEIYQIFKNNKRVLLLLLEQGYIKLDEKIISDIMKSKDTNDFPYSHYLYQGIKSFISKKELQRIESEIKQNYNEDLNKFEEKCRIGENNSYLCSLIRQDSAEEFISYVNRANISPSSKIFPSIFETNLFLMHNTPTLIEYAAFFGSIQIIQYLKYNKVSLTNSLWIYAIHSNNPDMIHFLEENITQPNKDDKNNMIPYRKAYEESIICHHNAISHYLEENYLDHVQNDLFAISITNSNNYLYYPTNIIDIISKTKNAENFSISQLCFPLKQITIPSYVTSIGNDAFSECSSLIQITIPSSVNTIGKNAFLKCSSLKQVVLPSLITLINDNCFFRCSSLTQITIPPSVTSIGDSVFSECTSLTQISIPSSVESIGNYAFFGCSSLANISIPLSVKLIKDNAFNKCSSLKQISIPSSVASIKMGVFAGCSSLTQVTIPSSVSSIGYAAFYKCSSLKCLHIPQSVTSIGDLAFADCLSLTQIYIPPSVTSIGSNILSGCPLLKQ